MAEVEHILVWEGEAMDPPPESIVARPGVELRRERVGDADAIAAGVASCRPDLAAWLPWATDDRAVDPEHQRARLAEAAQRWDDGTEFVYVIVVDDRIVGCMGLHPRVGPGGIEIGYWLRSDHTGHGVVTACAGALTAAVVALPGVDRVEIHCDLANARSAAVPRRLGYRLARLEPTPVTEAGPAGAETGRSMMWVWPPERAG
jgi:RimJ/RimL family protein N-acetyltransferase